MKKLTVLFFLFCSVGFSQQLINSYQFTAICSTTTGNIYPIGDAMSECNGEADSIGAWSGAGTSVESVETDPYEGTSAILLSNTSTDGSDRMERTFTVENGESYEVRFWYKFITDNGAQGGALIWGGVTSSPNTFWNEDGAWHEEVINITTNSTSLLIRLYAARSATPVGSKWMIDKFSIVKTS